MLCRPVVCGAGRGGISSGGLAALRGDHGTQYRSNAEARPLRRRHSEEAARSMVGVGAMKFERFAIQLMIAQGALFAAETLAIHQIGSRASVMQLAFLRGAAGLVLVITVSRHL